MTNLESLVHGGVVPQDCADHLSPEELDAIGSLTPQEVECAISAAQKLGRTFFEEHASHGVFF